METVFRGVGRFGWGLSIVTLLSAIAGCGHFTELEAEGPSALHQKRPVAA
jgi:hypothetical protein